MKCYIFTFVSGKLATFYCTPHPTRLTPGHLVIKERLPPAIVYFQPQGRPQGEGLDGAYVKQLEKLEFESFQGWRICPDCTQNRPGSSPGDHF